MDLCPIMPTTKVMLISTEEPILPRHFISMEERILPRQFEY